MSKISLIIKREYLSRVKKKSFLIMTILGPVLFAGIFVVPIWLSTQKPDKQTFEVIDESHLLINLIPEKEGIIHFDYPPITLKEAQTGFYDTKYDAILWIPPQLMEQPAIKIFYKDKIGLTTTEYISSTISSMLYNIMMVQNHVDVNLIKDAQQKSQFTLITEKYKENGKSEKTNVGVNFAIGLVASILIYFFIFFYGVQVMRGVMEEKSNRIVEVILSSVKPFQLMMGKIIGIALVGLTQFLLWIILTSSITTVLSATVLKGVDMKQIQHKEEIIRKGENLNYKDMKKIEQNQLFEGLDALKSINFTQILLCFLFYFLGAYLLYAALFAAVGSAVDNEADTQQFMMPITIPLILAMFVSTFVMSNPDSSIGFWFSIIPFTSPIVMMARLPNGGVPLWELLLSMSLLVVTFILMTWLAGRIYRTGILMYGKKVTWRELGKWLFYKA